MNYYKLAELPGETMRYCCLDDLHKHSECKLDRGKLQPKFDKHRYSGVVDLKIGALAILQINLDVGKGLCNGAQGTIVDFGSYPNTEIVTEQFDWMQQKDIAAFLRKNGGPNTQYPFVRFHHADSSRLFAVNRRRNIKIYKLRITNSASTGS